MRTCKTIQLGSKENRAANDFYATDPKATVALLKQLHDMQITLPGLIIEPSVGMGHIAIVLQKLGKAVYGYDIVDRGWQGVCVQDWITVQRPTEEPLAIVMNPPYSLALSHLEHALSLLKEEEYCCALLRLQFLEGKQRKLFFEANPMRYVFVFSYRVRCDKNADPAFMGSVKSHSAVAFAWFVWQKGYTGRPEIIWL